MTNNSYQPNNKYFCNRCKDQNYLIECADNCGEIIFRFGKNRVIRKYKEGHKPKRENSHRWNGGVRYRHNYRYILMPDYPRAQYDGYVPEHVYVFQEYYKCSLLPWAEIHHIDPVREGYCNNMPWNLQGVSRWYHRTLDRTKDSDDWRCSKCENGTYIKPNGRPMWYYNKEGKLLCKQCYDKSKLIKKERKKKDWTGTICYLCDSNKTVKNGRGNWRWHRFENKGFICEACYKKILKRNKG